MSSTQPLLAQLQLVQEEHHDDADQQRDEGRVERHAQALRHARDLALDRLVRLAERVADAPHGADEADRGIAQAM